MIGGQQRQCSSLIGPQLILTKICLMLGVHVYIPCHFLGISEPVLQEEGSLVAGWRAKFGEENQSADSFVFDVIVGKLELFTVLRCFASSFVYDLHILGASGKNCVMDGFSRYRLEETDILFEHFCVQFGRSARHRHHGKLQEPLEPGGERG